MESIPPIRYEAFMKTFGKTNTLQASCQSGEDNLEVEVQTEEVTKATAWTQRPPTFGGQGDNLDPREVRSSLLGVGWEEEKKGDAEVKLYSTVSPRPHIFYRNCLFLMHLLTATPWLLV